MFEKWKQKKLAQQKVDSDVQLIFSIVNRIMHKNSDRISVADIVGFYTLTVAYGIHIKQFNPQELPLFKNRLYASSLTSGMNRAQRGSLIIGYDQLISEHFEYFAQINSNDIKPRIKEMLERTNSMNVEHPECMWPTNTDDLAVLEAIINDVICN